MVKVEDLTGIPEEKRKGTIACLDDLLTFKDNQGQPDPVIKGYNLYTKLPKVDSSIILSNIHETEAYKQDMIKDLEKLGYNPKEILEFIRNKTGVFLHDSEFRIKNNQGIVLTGLRIKDVRTGEYLDLENLSNDFLNGPEFKNAENYLIDEDCGWELDFPFNNKRELRKVINLFLRKSGIFIYDKKGIKIPETGEQRKLREPWVDAYGTPILLIGKKALEYKGLQGFTAATKISLKENNNEINFVIHKNLPKLKKLDQYKLLQELGFCEEKCLGNNQFIRYVDKKR